MIKKIRILVVDDSSVARGLLRHALEDTTDIEVIAEASNGKQAIALVHQLHPDLMTLDLEMPVMDGLETITHVMAEHALPILVVSNVNDASKAYQAVQRGALDVIAKPAYMSTATQGFVDKVRSLARVRVITHLRSHVSAPFDTHKAKLPEMHVSNKGPQHVIAIASSTGGPSSLAHILQLLPAHFATPILIAQHISEGFAAGMVHWLAGLCKLPVVIAQPDTPICAGVVYVATSEHHLVVTRHKHFAWVPHAEPDVYHPSCDLLLGSVADAFGSHATGIILTGMGRDGVQGMAKIFAAGGKTIGQDEASSIVFGMNRAAIEHGVVQQVLSLEHIANEVLRIGT
jgi:two-component system chemotaxis response regulator CheB